MEYKKQAEHLGLFCHFHASETLSPRFICVPHMVTIIRRAIAMEGLLGPHHSSQMACKSVWRAGWCAEGNAVVSRDQGALGGGPPHGGPCTNRPLCCCLC